MDWNINNGGIRSTVARSMNTLRRNQGERGSQWGQQRFRMFFVVLLGGWTTLQPIADTFVPTIINNATWAKSGGRYIVPANATVSRGQVLHIEPGVEVIFGPGVHMYIDGRIQAQGLSDDPIRFHAISVSNQWDSIRVPDRGPEARSIFRWCTFSDSTVGLWLYAIGGEIEHQEVSSCVFENCGTGIVGWSTGESDRAITPNSLDALIQNCRFVNCATNGLTFVLRRNGDGLPYDRRGMASPVCTKQHVFGYRGYGHGV